MTIYDIWLAGPVPQPESVPAPTLVPPVLPKKVWKPKEKPKVLLKDLPMEVSLCFTFIKKFKLDSIS